MYAPQASCGVVFVKLSFHVMGFALRLKLAQVFQHALPFGRRYLFFFGGFSFFPEIALSLGNLTVVVFYYGFCLLVGRHERPCIGIVAPPLEQLHPQICPIQIVLRHSQVSSCHLVIAVVIDIWHNQTRLKIRKPFQNQDLWQLYCEGMAMDALHTKKRKNKNTRGLRKPVMPYSREIRMRRNVKAV